MFQLFTRGAKEVLNHASRAQEEFRHDYIGPEHLLLGLVESTGSAIDILKELEVDPERIREGVERLIAESRTPVPKHSITPEEMAAASERYARHGGDLDAQVDELVAEILQEIESGVGGKVTPWTPELQTVWEKVQEEASALGHSHIGTAHLLLGLLRGGDSIAARVLREEHVRLVEVRALAKDGRSI